MKRSLASTQVRLLLALAAVVGAMSYGTPAYAQSPADAARFPTNATIEFESNDYLGEQHRLKIARDPLLQQVVYDRADSYEIGQWFVVPRNRGMTPGTYYWQACWVEWNDESYEDESACTDVRTLHLTRSRIPTLTLSKAKSVVRAVYDDMWTYGNGKRYGCRRVSRIRMRCRPSAWAGDTVATATLRMVNRMSGATRVTGKIEYYSEYCADVRPWDDCADTKRVSRLY